MAIDKRAAKDWYKQRGANKAASENRNEENSTIAQQAAVCLHVYVRMCVY